MAKKYHYEATLDTKARLLVISREDRPPQVLIDFSTYVLPVVSGKNSLTASSSTKARRCIPSRCLIASIG